MKKITIGVSILILHLFPTISTAQTGLVAQKAMVVSAREEASKIGVENFNPNFLPAQANTVS